MMPVYKEADDDSGNVQGTLVWTGVQTGKTSLVVGVEKPSLMVCRIIIVGIQSLHLTLHNSPI